MDNHVHHVLVPQNEASLAQTLKATHMRYATIINGIRGWTGHLWQERYYSAPLDDEYFWTAMHYVERNPVKAGIVTHASEYPWSSAKAHCNLVADPVLSIDSEWTSLMSEQDNWYSWLGMEADECKVKTLRAQTRRDLPCGNERFLKTIGDRLGRHISNRNLHYRITTTGKGTEGTVP